jgi:general stress protein 26
MDNKVKEARAQAWQNLQRLIKDVETAMLTTVSKEDFLRSRPMMTQHSDDDGVLWFFTNDHHATAQELGDDPRVNVSYSKTDSQQFVSVSGLGEVVHDDDRKRELWKPSYKTWFPDGVDDPHLALLKVYIEKAEYWDAPDSKWVELAGFAKALLTGKPYEASREEHDTIDLLKNPLPRSSTESQANN